MLVSLIFFLLLLLGAFLTGTPELLLKQFYRTRGIPEKALRMVRTLGILMLLAALLFLMLVLVSSRA